MKVGLYGNQSEKQKKSWMPLTILCQQGEFTRDDEHPDM